MKQSYSLRVHDSHKLTRHDELWSQMRPITLVRNKTVNLTVLAHCFVFVSKPCLSVLTQQYSNIFSLTIPKSQRSLRATGGVRGGGAIVETSPSGVRQM
jgi:hypothetical protein